MFFIKIDHANCVTDYGTSEVVFNACFTNKDSILKNGIKIDSRVYNNVEDGKSIMFLLQCYNGSLVGVQCPLNEVLGHGDNLGFAHRVQLAFDFANTKKFINTKSKRFIVQYDGVIIED